MEVQLPGCMCKGEGERERDGYEANDKLTFH